MGSDQRCPDPCDVQSSGDGDVLCSACKKPTDWIKGQGFVHRRPAGDQPRRVRQLVPDGSRTGWGLPPCEFCFEPISKHTEGELRSCRADLDEITEIDMDEEVGDDIVIF